MEDQDTITFSSPIETLEYDRISGEVFKFCVDTWDLPSHFTDRDNFLEMTFEPELYVWYRITVWLENNDQRCHFRFEKSSGWEEFVPDVGSDLMKIFKKYFKYFYG